MLASLVPCDKTWHPRLQACLERRKTNSFNSANSNKPLCNKFSNSSSSRGWAWVEKPLQPSFSSSQAALSNKQHLRPASRRLPARPRFKTSTSKLSSQCRSRRSFQALLVKLRNRRMTSVVCRLPSKQTMVRVTYLKRPNKQPSSYPSTSSPPMSLTRSSKCNSRGSSSHNSPMSSKLPSKALKMPII